MPGMEIQQRPRKNLRYHFHLILLIINYWFLHNLWLHIMTITANPISKKTHTIVSIYYKLHNDIPCQPPTKLFCIIPYFMDNKIAVWINPWPLTPKKSMNCFCCSSLFVTLHITKHWNKASMVLIFTCQNG